MPSIGIPAATAGLDQYGYYLECPACGARCRATAQDIATLDPGDRTTIEDSVTKGAARNYGAHYGGDHCAPPAEAWKCPGCGWASHECMCEFPCAACFAHDGKPLPLDHRAKLPGPMWWMRAIAGTCTHGGNHDDDGGECDDADAAIIHLDADGRYRPVLCGITLDPWVTGYRTYAEALESLKLALAASDLDPERTPTRFHAVSTGLVVDFPMALPEVVVNWDRPPTADDEAWFASTTGIHEGFCLLCGETCNPHGADEMVHGQREDGAECGGPLVITGAWGAKPRG